MVLRLDGLRADYAGTPSATDGVQLELARLADHVVFQSRYSRDVFAKAGFSSPAHSVIPNGVDGNVFHPGARQPWDGRRPLRLLASSWSENPAKGHAAVAAFAALPGVELRFVGRWPAGLERGTVRVEPPMAHAALAGAYRWADAFLFPARREACPNAALEAMASGLPLLYHAEGGTAEVAAPYGVELSSDPAADLARLKNEYGALFERVRKDRVRFTISRAGGDYLTLFKGLCADR
ncbi:MAG: glycosyltransferase family 4 protein [Elusimicrobia bacterium]|nr:glycosyltransferase family 4 protein [Elusimicrobiota bacterium]